MFVGHFAVGFGSKKVAPRTNLALLISAALFLDILWPVFLLLGWEHVRIDLGNTRFTPLDLYDYPWSHSLLLSIAWASAFALVYYLVARYWPGTIAIFAGVISHWVLDWITHRPDMPLYPGSPGYGLGLWNSIAGTLVVELVMFVTGVGLYMAATRAQDPIGRYAFVVFVVLLLVLYIGDRFSAPPTSVVADIAWPGIIAEFVLIPWIWWFDAHRRSR